MGYAVIAIVCLAIGFITCFFIMRNNRKYFNVEDMLRIERDRLLPLGKAKLEALKQKIEDALKQ